MYIVKIISKDNRKECITETWEQEDRERGNRCIELAWQTELK